MLPLYFKQGYLFRKKGKGLRKGFKVLVMLLFTFHFLSFIAYTQPNITRVEYYIDVDPGQGNATAMTIVPGIDIIDQVIAIDPATVSEGVHRLYVRALDANGKWSLTNSILFYKPYSGGVSPPPPAPPTNIVRVEYYIDVDPGNGNATTLAITPGTDIADVIIAIDPGTISEGVHRLYVRALNANGNWSLVNSLLFYKPYSGGISPPPPAPPTNITLLEYYIDVDPGFGSGTAISITPGVNLVDVIVPIDPATVSEGVHRFNVRARNANGNWSLTNTWLFYKPYGGGVSPPPAVLAKLRKLEYYIDTDPGFGNAIPVALDSLTNFPDYVVPINVTGLTTGDHKLWVRALDLNGKWSMVNSYTFNVPTTLAAPTIVVTSVTDKSGCAKDSFSVSYHVTGTYNAGNVFNVELSDATGTFAATPPLIGSFTGTTSTTIKVNLPPHSPDGVNYRVRVSGTNPVVTGITGSDAIVVYDRPYAQTITGRNEVNGTFTWPYSVPSVATSTYNWLVSGGARINGTNTNAGDIEWTMPAGQSFAGYVKVVETNQYGCIGDTGMLNINIYKLRLDNTTSDLSLCRGEALLVNYNADGAFDAGNILTAQLSDAAGSFASPTTIGSKALVASGINQVGTINTNIPTNAVLGTGYRVRVISSAPVVTGTDNGSNIVVADCICGKNLTSTVPPGIDSVAITYTALSNTSGLPAAPYYTNYPPGAGTTALVYRGDRFELSMKVSNGGLGYNVGVWVDYNNNNLFEASENVILTSRSATVGSDWAVIPLSLSVANARLRIRVSTDVITADDACKTLGNGETEDYTLSFSQVYNCRWIGRVSSDWHNPNNWSCGNVPDATKSVYIPGGTPFSCHLTNGDATVDRIRIETGATVTVENTRKLNVNGTNVIMTW